MHWNTACTFNELVLGNDQHTHRACTCIQRALAERGLALATSFPTHGVCTSIGRALTHVVHSHDACTCMGLAYATGTQLNLHCNLSGSGDLHLHPKCSSIGLALTLTWRLYKTYNHIWYTNAWGMHLLATFRMDIPDRNST